ncbi:unnamed protein product, partial [marine sediment metagenome]
MSAVDIKSAVEELKEKGRAAKVASKQMAKLPTEVKNKALHNIADGLLSNQEKILAANEIDCKGARAAGLSEAIIDRLRLTPARLKSTAQGVLSVEALFDPVGEVMDMRTLSNGLIVGRKRVPLGVIGAIYESRPNVTIDIS